MSMRRAWIIASALTVAMIAGAPCAWAQFSSAIEGTVVDPQAGVIPGATVSITNEETGVTYTLTTTEAGYYRQPSLPGGFYTVRISLSGFKTAVQEHIRVQVAETKTINLTLETGAVEEQVTVTATAPLVETSQARVSGVIEEDQVKDLPLVGRNFFNLVVLTPGVTGRASGGGQAYAQSNADLFINEYGVAMNANGARTESNNFMVDSATISSSQRSGVINITPNPEVVEEVRVAVNNFSVETGRNGSVLVNVVTKSGTNLWHGSGTFFFTNNEMQGKNNFQKQDPNFEHPNFSRKESAWGLGGPIARDRTFFFTSGDVLRSDVAINRAGRVLTQQFKDFMRASRPNNTSTYVMNTFQPSFQAERNFLTAGQTLSVACAGGEFINSSVGPIPCNLPVTGEGTFNTTSPRRGLQWTGRLDHYFSGMKDRVYGSFNRTTVDKVLFGTPDVYPDFNTISPTNGMQFNSNWARSLSPNMLNEAQFSWVRVYGNLPLNRPDVPGIQVTGIERYQTTWGPNDFVQNNFEWRDVVTWTRGTHTMKLGGEYTRQHADNEGSRVFNRPIYSFANVFDFASDSPTRQENLAIDPASGGPVTHLLREHRTFSVSVFAQEDWKARPNLTLSFGLRYEGFSNISDAAGDMTAIEFASRTGDLRQDLRTARIVEKPHPLNGPLHTIAPRVGFAWDPSGDGKLSLRGGWGQFYERMSNQLWDSEYTNLPAFAVTTATIFDPVRPVFGLGTSAEMPYNYPRPAGLTSGLNNQGGLVNGRAKADLLDPDIGKMRLDNWFVGLQRGLGPNMVVEADYIGSRGNNMYVRYNVNRFAGDMFDGRYDGLMPGVSALLFGQSIDKSHYHGATFAFKTNYADLNFGGAYTFGKATDFSSTITPPARPDAHGPADQDEGPSDFDIPHKLSMSVNWTLPEPADGGMRHLLGGWQVAGVLLTQTGTPFNVVCNGRPFAPVRDPAGAIIGNTGCDYNADNDGNDRPNAPSFGTDISNRSDQDFLSGVFRAADFGTPTPGTNGSLRRNAYRGPAYFNVDLSVIKRFRVGWFTQDRATLQIRFEAFNALNTTNLENPVGNLSDPLFGRSISALPGRILQLSGRIEF
jgi:hypothetical protein